ncbi:MAG: SbcC/MukB-like Walker B domain-containing protein [Pseudomonadota bacterium]|jgi:exonuclease SbcC
MKLRSLEMQLFRQHVDGYVEFPDGLVGIIGVNGSGKTTIMEAVAFGIFGSRALRGRTEDVRTRTAPGRGAGRNRRDSEMRVTLSIEHEGTVFRIERSLSDAALFVGGEAHPVAEGNREVTAKLNTLIGMSYEEFVATYCTEQKGLEFLSGKRGATEREKFIIRILGYDRLEDLQELLRTDRKEKRAVLQGYEASVGTREELEQRLASEEQQLRTVRERHDEAQQALLKAEGEFSQLRTRMQKQEEQRARYIKERDGIQALEVRVEERAKRLRTLADSIIEIEDDLKRALRPLAGQRGVEQVIADTKRESILTRDAIESITRALQASEVAWRENLSKIRAEREALERQAAQVEQRVRKVKSLDAGGECPTCSQPLGETFEAVHAHLASELAELSNRVEKLIELERQHEVPPSDLEQQRQALLSTQQDLERIQIKLQELGACQQMEQKITAIGLDQRTTEADMRAAEENLERARKRIAEVGFAEDEYLKEKGAHDAAQRLVEVARLQRVRLEGEVNTQSALVARSQSDLERFDERQAELEKLRREVRLFDECDRIVSDFRKYVNTSIRPRMAELASEYLTDLTDGRYSAVELAEDFTPTVIEDGEVKRVISGGEEDILNLCMRIALSHMLAERAGQSFSLLMLDEVFGSLDEGRRGNVLALLEKLRRRFEQIIIITHLDDIKDGVQHLIQVEYDEGDGSAKVVGAAGDGPELGTALNV